MKGALKIHPVSRIPPALLNLLRDTKLRRQIASVYLKGRVRKLWLGSTANTEERCDCRVRLRNTPPSPRLPAIILPQTVGNVMQGVGNTIKIVFCLSYSKAILDDSDRGV